MGWFKRKNSTSAWASQGEMTQAALRSYFELIDPSKDSDSAAELKEIRTALATVGQWSKDDEWRISTFMKASILPSTKDFRENWFDVVVECDGQQFSCSCPSIERAFAFYRLYSHLIIYQFYAVGPPWHG